MPTIVSLEGLAKLIRIHSHPIGWPRMAGALNTGNQGDQGDRGDSGDAPAKRKDEFK
jgi:hypothetical protein